MPEHILIASVGINLFYGSMDKLDFLFVIDV